MSETIASLRRRNAELRHQVQTAEENVRLWEKLNPDGSTPDGCLPVFLAAVMLSPVLVAIIHWLLRRV
jgi:hypothetical protein